MNPISGTYPYPAAGPDGESVRRFLADTKESEELVTVVDEELKMMSQVGANGGRVQGPTYVSSVRLPAPSMYSRGTPNSMLARCCE